MPRNRFVPFLHWVYAAILLTFLAGCSVPGTEAQALEAAPPAEGTGTAFPTGLRTRESPPAATSTQFNPTDRAEVVSTDAAPTEAAPTLYFTPTQPFTSTPTPLPPVILCSPLEGHTLSDLHEILTNPFAPPSTGKDTGHHGVDFAYYRRGERQSILGVPVDSVLAGHVAGLALNRIPYGNMVIVETPGPVLSSEIVEALGISAGDSLYMLYAHMNSAPLVSLDERVSCGQVLGEVGNTPKGWSSDPHLHLEARVGPPGTRFQSMDFYDTGATPEEMENYRLWRMSGEFQMVDPMILLEMGLE